MGTRGFIAVKTADKTIAVYNHSDSYPTWLGARVFGYVRAADLVALAEGMAKIVTVKEDEKPSAEQLADLKARGFWQDVSTGDDWYAALREAQGDLDKYIEAGYIPGFDPTSAIAGDESWLEWGYLIDPAVREVTVYQLNHKAPAKSKVFLVDLIEEMSDADITAAMNALEYTERR